MTPDAPIPSRTTYRDVREAILSRITDGTWGAGTILPSEMELAEAFGCARATVNRAMREIEELGLVERKRKSGTRVRAAPVRQARFEIPLVGDEIVASGGTYRYALVSTATLPAPDWLRGRMGLGAGDRVVHVTAMHYADGAPHQFEDRWINATALPEVLQASFDTQGPTEWLIAAVPYSEVEIGLMAVAAEGPLCDHLGHAPGAPVFRVERTTWWQGQSITHVRLNHAPGYRMTTRY